MFQQANFQGLDLKDVTGSEKNQYYRCIALAVGHRLLEYGDSRTLRTPLAGLSMVTNSFCEL
jgi:predicted ATPase with chaperone activity